MARRTMAQRLDLVGRVYKRLRPYAPTVNRALRVPFVLPLVVLLVAFAVRFHQLETQSLWNDEGNSLRLAQRAVPDLVDAAGRDIHPPGYYLALHFWIDAAGSDEFGLRALSAFEGVLAVAVTLALGRALGSQAAGLVAGGLVALSPFAVYYSQETRMYAQVALLSAASMWAFAAWLQHTLPPASGRVVQRSRRRAWGWALALALVNAAGLYTHYAFPFTMLAQGVVVVAVAAGRIARSHPTRSTNPRDVLPGFVALNLVTLALVAPWLGTAWDQVTSWPGTGVGIALDRQLQTVFSWIVYGNTAGRVAWSHFLWPALLVGVALWRVRTWRGWLPLGWAVAVIASLFVTGAYREANLKFLLPAQIAAALLMGRGAAELWRLGVRIAAGDAQRRSGRITPREWHYIARMLAVMCVFLVAIGQADALHALYTDATYQRDDYRAIAARIAANARPADAVILDAPNQVEVFSYYYAGDLPVYQLPRGLGGDDAQTRAEVQAVIRDHERIYAVFWGEEERDPNRVVQATLDAAAFPVDSRWYGDVRLALYATLGVAPAQPDVTRDARYGEHITLQGYALSAESVQPGDVVGVTLFWTTDAPLDVRYKVTVQLLAPDGHLIAQHDAEPGGNRVLTTTWAPGETVRDTHGLIVPPDLPPDEYRIMVGLYNVVPPQERLPVSVDGNLVGDMLALTGLRVE